MRSRKLGKTGLTVSELSLGTWGLSGEAYGPIPKGEVARVLERALAMGINLVETSDSYGQGKIESTIGETLGSEEIVVVTKWGTDRESKPPRKCFNPEYLREAAEKSRARLGDKIRLIALLHNPSAAAVREGLGAPTLRELSESGVISSWGISAGSKEVTQAALDAGAPIISVAYNILQVEPLRVLAKEIESSETGILAHSILFYGLLTGRWSPAKSFRLQDHRTERWAPGTLRSRISQLAAIRPLVSGDVVSMRSAAARFVLSNPLVSSAVLGPRTTSQLDQLVRECSGGPPYLSQAKLTSLENRLKEHALEQ